MDFFSYFVNLYNSFLALFPAPIQWVITLMVVIGLVVGFFNLVRYNALFLILVILFLPIFIPVLQHFFADVYNFFLYLLGLLGVRAPAS